MSYLHYTRERERSPYVMDSDPYYSRPLVRRNSKRQRVDLYDDDEYDDYPYASSAKPSKPSRALTIRQPSQLEKFNVWSYPSSHDDRHHEPDEHDHGHGYKYTQKHYVSRPSASDDEDEREFRLKVKATLSRPKSSHSRFEKAMVWPGELFKRREKWEGVEWDTKERERRGSFWDDEPQLKERTIKYRKIKRTRTDEWKPLSGFRRF